MQFNTWQPQWRMGSNKPQSLLRAQSLLKLFIPHPNWIGKTITIHVLGNDLGSVHLSLGNSVFIFLKFY